VDDETVLLLHFDGTQGSTTFTDYGKTGHTVSSRNNTKITQNEKKFGVSCGKFLASNENYLTVPDHANWSFSTGAWCIDFWYKAKTITADMGFFRQKTDEDNYHSLWYDYSEEKIMYDVDTFGGLPVNRLSYSITPAAFKNDKWIHIALIDNWSEDSAQMALCINGVVADSYDGFVTTPGDYTSTFNIGRAYNASQTDVYLNGYLDGSCTTDTYTYKPCSMVFGDY